MKKECSAGYDCDACKVPEMALRDWFAGMAMKELIRKYNHSERLIAAAAYTQADEMMKEREK